MRRLLVVFLALALVPAVNAASLVIDFEEKTPDISPTTAQGPDFGISQGFHFYRPDSNAAGGYVTPDLGSIGATGNSSGVALDWCGICDSGALVMERQDATAFDLLGLDFIAVSPIFLLQGTLTVTGTYQGGGTTEETFTSALGANVWDSASFGAGWTGLSSLTFTGDVDPSALSFVMGLDNISVAAVPVPAALPLLGSALLLLGWRRRGSKA